MAVEVDFFNSRVYSFLHLRFIHQFLQCYVPQGKNDTLRYKNTLAAAPDTF